MGDCGCPGAGGQMGGLGGVRCAVGRGLFWSCHVCHANEYIFIEQQTKSES